jgi:hypothetical protein
MVKNVLFFLASDEKGTKPASMNSSSNGDFLDCVGWSVYSQVPSNSYISHEAEAEAGGFDGLGFADIDGAGAGCGGGGCGGGGCGGGGCGGGW